MSRILTLGLVAALSVAGFCGAGAISAEDVPGSEPAWSLPEGVPPSPSTASGERIWPAPRFTHWPAVVYADEERNGSFALPVRAAGVAGWIGWRDGERLPFVLPADTDRTSGLVALPRALGLHTAEVAVGDEQWELTLRVADARAAWPLAALVDGFPVDADGVPVVLVDQRRDPAVERQWKLLVQGLPRGTGPAVVIGDPLAALGESVFMGLDADCRIAVDDRRSDHAALVALAGALDPVPRTLIWSPGNANVFLGTWTAEEERVLAVVRSRCAVLGAQPRCVLLLPPIPLDAALQESARERREMLARSAAFQGWQVLDAERLAGPAAEANRVADGLYTRHPIGPARDRIVAALRAELAR